MRKYRPKTDKTHRINLNVIQISIEKEEQGILLKSEASLLTDYIMDDKIIIPGMMALHASTIILLIGASLNLEALHVEVPWRLKEMSVVALVGFSLALLSIICQSCSCLPLPSARGWLNIINVVYAWGAFIFYVYCIYMMNNINI